MKLFLISIHEAFKTVLKNIVDEAVATVVEPLINEIHQLQEEVGSLKSRLVKVEMIANENEQYSRKYNLRFVSLEETKEENCSEKIINFWKTKLDITINPSEIDSAHCVGRQSPSVAENSIDAARQEVK